MILVVAIAVCAVLTVSGCAANKPAATVGDDAVTVTQVQNAYTNASSQAGYYGYDISTDEGRLGFLDYLVEALAKEKVLAYEAKKAGYEMTEEELAQAEKDAQESYDEFYQGFLDNYKNVTDAEAYANKQFATTLSKNGMTVKSFKESLLANAKDSLLAMRYQTDLMKTYKLSDEEVKAMYEEERASQEKSISENAGYFFILQNYYDNGFSFMPLVRPEGLFYVKQILVEDEETAKKVKQSLDDGGDFEALLEEYNTDPGMKSSPEGYIVGEGAAYTEEFLNAALALEKEGDVSDIVPSSFGYHIIKRLGDLEPGDVPYEEIENDFKLLALGKYKSEQFEAYLEGIVAEDLVKYPQNYANIGK